MNFTREFVEAGYNNRAAVADHQYWLDKWREDSAAARAAYPPLSDLRYGAGPKETLDLYLPARPARGTLLFLHGGWWRGIDKSDNSLVAPVFVDAGYAVAMPNYDLSPTVSVATIVDEARRALLWLVHEGAARSANTQRIVVGGHSVGGHLTAMLFATDWTRHGLDRVPVIGGVSLSGVHDLRPLTLYSANEDWRLSDADAVDLSPALKVPTIAAPLLIAVGADETREFVRQSQLLRDAWPAQRPPGSNAIMEIAERHHYDVLCDYAEPDSTLARATLALFESH